jgi:hypothetical protein
MKISFASLFLAFLFHQQSFAGSQCPDFSGKYQSGNNGSWAGTSRLKQNRCDSLEFFLVAEYKEYKILQLKMEGRPLYDKQLDKITVARWISSTLSYVEYEDVSRYGYSRYTEARLEIEGNTLKWSYRQFMNGKMVDQGTAYVKRIQ